MFKYVVEQNCPPCPPLHISCPIGLSNLFVGSNTPLVTGIVCISTNKLQSIGFEPLPVSQSKSSP